MHKTPEDNMNNKDISLRFFDAVVDNDIMWTVSDDLCAIYKINLIDGKINYVSSLIDQKTASKIKISRIIKLRDNLFVFSKKAPEVWIYNLKKKTTFKHLYNSSCYYDCEYVFYNEDRALIIPRNFNGTIFTFDFNTYLFEERQVDTNTTGQFNIGSACIAKKQVFFIDEITDKIYKIDLVTAKLELCDNIGIMKARRIAYDGNSFWITFRDKTSLLKWDPKTGISSEYPLNASSDESDRDPYRFILCYQNYILLLPRLRRDIVVLNKQENKLEPYDIDIMGFKHMLPLESSSLFAGGIGYNNKFYLFPWNCNKLVHYDIEKDIINSIDMQIPNEEIKEAVLLLNYLKISGKTVKESGDFGLPEFTDMLKTDRLNIINDSTDTLDRKNAGSIIYDEINKLLLSDF